MTETTVQTAVRSAERNAILSSCCGVLGETTLTDSAVVLLFAGMLGAGARLSLMMTSLLPLLNGLCIVPMAMLAARSWKDRRLTLGSCLLAGAAYFAAASAPWFGHAASSVLLASVFCFSLFMAGFVAGWFPLLDTFLASERRVAFFGRLRLCHQMTGVIFLFGVGLLIGRHPDAGTMQTVLFAGAIIFIGRAGFIARIPVFPERNVGGAEGVRQGLAHTAANRPLIGFGRYVFALNLAAYGIVPLALLELKNRLHAPDNAVMTVSATALAGMLLGYALTARAVRRWTVPGLFRSAHLVFALIALALFGIGGGGVFVYILMAALLLVHSFFVAATSVVSSSEMLALADAGNRVVDMAVFGAFFYGGQGLSRLVASLFMGAGSGAVPWHIGGFSVDRYRLVFLLSAAVIVWAARVLPGARASKRRVAASSGHARGDASDIRLATRVCDLDACWARMRGGARVCASGQADACPLAISIKRRHEKNMKWNMINAVGVAACLGAGMAAMQAQGAPETSDVNPPKEARRFVGFEHGMGIGGWLTNYKRFNVLPDKWKMTLSPGDYEHFDTYITKDDIRNIASLGMDHIRLGFDQIVLEEKPYVYRERTFRCIDNFIAWCHEYKVNVVLNLHKAVGNYCDVPSPVNLLDDAELQNRFVALWSEFERRYHADNAVAFELLNEVKDVKPAAWNALAARTVAAIRKVNPTRKIIIGSTCWNSCDRLKDLQVFDEPNVIYTFHFYSPFEFTHQRGVLQAGPLYYNRAMPYPSDIERYRDYKRFVDGAKNPYPQSQRMDVNVLREWLRPAFDFVKKHPDKILWCGEFGTIRHADITSRENWMNDVILLLKEHGIPYCVWNYLSTPNDGNRFSLVDDDKRQILSDRLHEVILGNVKPLHP